MQLARIAELLQPFLPQTSQQQLTEKDLSDISMYIDILQRWNARINLTAIRNEEEIVTRHFGESLFAAAQLFPTRDSNSTARRTLADVGSGAGFPGLPVKLWAPEISLTLIEANQKKATFLREAVRSLELEDVLVLNARAEEVTRKFDFVTFRAVEGFKNVLPVSAQLLTPSGRLALLISKPQVPVAQSLGLQWQPPLPIPESISRVLLIGSVE